VLNHFTTSPRGAASRAAWSLARPLFSLAAPRGFEPRFTDPKSAVLPLDEGAAALSRGARPLAGQRNGAEDGTRTRDPHLGKVMLYQLSHFRSMSRPPDGGAESQIRTGDTAIFSRVLYQLSYLGPMANQALAARRRVGGYHALERALKATETTQGGIRPAESEASERCGGVSRGRPARRHRRPPAVARPSAHVAG
jgi:hypothetical protein